MFKDALKKIAKGKTNKAFTDWDFYSPKKPKIIEKMIEGKKDK